MNAVVEVETIGVALSEIDTFVYVITNVAYRSALSQVVSASATHFLEVLRNLVAPAPNTIFEGNTAAG